MIMLILIATLGFTNEFTMIMVILIATCRLHERIYDDNGDIDCNVGFTNEFTMIMVTLIATAGFTTDLP